MLNAIVRFSLRFRGIIIALAVALLGYGIYSLTQARYDVFPEFAPAEVVIQTEAPGLSPEQIEVLVTQPIENEINGVTGVESVRSGTIQGASHITVVFQPYTDIYRDRQVVAERLAVVAGRLPLGVQPPVLEPLTSSTSVVTVIGMTSDKLSTMDLTTVADWTVKQRLLAVPGVSKVAVFGAEARQVQIQFIPEKLVQHDVTLDEVIAAAQRATGIRGAGFIATPNQRVILQTEGQALTPQQIARTVLIRHNGVNLTVGDVARVVDAPAPAIGGASYRGKRDVMLMVSSQYGANTLEVTAGVDRAIRELRPALAAQGIALHPNVFRSASFIETALKNVRHSLLIGAILIVVVLFLFLFNLRTAAISCAAIPLSLLAAVIVLEYLGQSLNTMTLGGLAIAIGEVVDDAVIDVENIYRRLRLNRHLPNPRPALQVVFDASIEVRSAVVYASFAVVLVFVPVLTMTGVAGRIFAPLGIAYIWAILASLVVALTVTPALSFLLLARRDLPEKEPPVVRELKGGYRWLLGKVEKHPWVVMGTVTVLVLGGFAILPFLEGSFVPELQEGHFIVHMTAVPGTSIEESLRMGAQVTQALLRLPIVSSVSQRVGRAELSDDYAGTHSSEFEVSLRSLQGKEARNAEENIRAALGQFAGATFSVNTFLTERINETLSGYAGGFVVNVFGNNLDQLDESAQKILAVLRQTPGARDAQVQSPPGMPQVVVKLRPADVARWGFDPVTVLDAVRTAYGGDVVGQIYQGNRVFDVSVILDPRERDRMEEIGALPLRGPDGNYVTLSRLADIYETSGRYIVLHEGARRVQAITCNIEGRDATAFEADVRQRIERLQLPGDTYVEFAGTAAAEAKSRRDLIVHSLLAGLGIVLLLSVVMRNARNLILVLANLPFALVGGVIAAAATGGQLSLGSMVGFVTLFGITLRNSIMMISHYEHLVESEGMTWGIDAAMRGASERLAPILMTALVTGLGLLPLAIGSGDPGREIEGPMAVVILGGLLTSTLLNLLVLPSLALRFGRFEKEKREL